jgi:phosphoglycolate phosphatase-like HAD superfamily hydrolase
MNNKAGLNIDALICAMPDILIDVNGSYRAVVRQTVQIYLEQAIGLAPSAESLLTPDEVILLEKIGGFTNYSELAAAFIIYFIEMLPPVPVPTFPSKFHIPAVLAYLQLAGGRLQLGVDKLREQKDIARLAHIVAAAGGGLDGAHEALPKENRHLLVDFGEVTRANLLGRIFQELYLGAELFNQIYEQPPIIVEGTGHIGHEALLIDAAILAQIAAVLPLGIVTSAARSQAEISLKAHQIEPYFQVVIALDDVEAAKAKPIPAAWPLLEAARRLSPTPARSAYVGANPADLRAAKTANETVPFTAIGCLAGAHDKHTLRQEFENLKADVILGHPNNLKELILG